jgi:Ser/Thr protein kinase RdoA (MazF antagonist)
MQPDIDTISRQFAITGDVIASEPFGGGHINDSYHIRVAGGSGYLLQRINERIFPRPHDLMENVERVTTHLRRRLVDTGATDVDRRVLEVIPTTDGAACLHQQDGSWRMYRFIDRTESRLEVAGPADAEAAGEAFGRFQTMLIDLPGPRLHEIIPGFHDTPARYATFEDAVARDPMGRAGSAAAEIDFARARRDLAEVLLAEHAAGAMPERVTHNDVKMSNILLDAATGEGLCVIDLDTVMPGLAVYDFGDMMRSMTCAAAEDERDLSRVAVDPGLFEGLASGYLRATRDMLTASEIEHLVFSGTLITLEQGVRFLTDYLLGDGYYKTSRPAQNLDRCRTQFRLVESFAAHDSAMQSCVDRLLS